MRLDSLNSSQLGGVLAAELGLPGSLTFKRHPQSGRNRIYIVHATGGRRLFVKIHPAGEGNEATVNDAIAPLELGIPPLLTLPDFGLTVFEYIDPLPTLEDVARERPKAALVALSMLGERVACIEDIAVPPSVRRTQPLFDFPFPHVNQVIDISTAAQQFLTEIQEIGLAAMLDTMPSKRLVLGHGDIKLDNLVLSEGQPFLIDWEAATLVPPGTDCAALAGLALTVIARSDPSLPEIESANFDSGFAAARLLAEIYFRRRSSDAVTARRFEQLVASFLIQRVLSECMYKQRPGRVDRLMVKIAQQILSQGLLHR
ncbi:MAG: aminoglycoside phosphotransferase family protein [Gallionella sp.]|nr:aminoglycoside phosphotransferase family protein [Gallionella sp.]